MIICFRKQIFFAWSMVFACSVAFAQQEINVNPAKGLMTVNVPIHQFDMLDFKVDLGFSYVAKGYQVASAPAMAVGWQFYGGGKITRILRDLPDEKVSSSGDLRSGWTNGVASLPTSFTVSDDGNESDCTDEAANNTQIDYNFPNTVDAQPDVFIVDAPGLSCRLMMDNNGVFKEISSVQDLKIEWLTNGSSDKYFVITDTKGIKYTFGEYSKITRQKQNTLYNVDLFKRSGNLFATVLTYPDTWYLTKIETTNHYTTAALTYNYTVQATSYPLEIQKVYIKNNTFDSARAVDVASTSLTVTGRCYLKKITNSLGTKIEFPGTGDFPSEINIYNNNSGTAPVDRRISFWTRGAYDSGAGGSKEFITIIYDSSNGCTRRLYEFEYYGLLNEGSGMANFPVKNVNKVDAWGYPNGNPSVNQVKQVYVYPLLKATTGAYRPYPIPGYVGPSAYIAGNTATVNPDLVMMGTLSKIIYPNGGSSTFEYESNSFLDGDVNAEVKGGGVRIKAINTFDGINTAVVNRKEYTYLNDTGQTSGVINKLPVYAISTPYYFDPISNVTKTYATILSTYGATSSAYWNHLTVRTTEDLSGGSEVSYSQVTVKEQGNGKIKLTFNTPVSFWNTANSVPTYPAEACTASNGTFISKAYYQYPFANIEHRDNQNEQLGEFYYNEAGNLIKKTEYTYEDYSVSPIKIYGVSWDTNYGIKQFSKYHTEIYKRLPLQIKETVYDSNLAGNGILLQTDFINSAYNRGVRSKTLTNSDGSKTRTSYVYSGDFAAYPLTDISSNPEAVGIYWLNNKNVKGEVLEESTAYAPSGSSTFSTISSSVNLYRKNTNAGYDYATQTQTRLFKNMDGITNFVPLNMAGTGTSKYLLWDSRYEAFRYFVNYNIFNMPAVIKEKRHATMLVNDYLLKVPLLKITGADTYSIAFSNFERIDALVDFAIENPSTAKEVKDPYTGNAYTLLANDGLNKKIATGPADRFFKFSFLAKASTATSVNIQIDGTTVANIPVAVSSSFKYYEKEIILAATGTPTVRMVAVGQLIVDNVIFYPSDAKYTATNYNYLVGKTLEMTESGMLRQYDYDFKGRLLDVKDIEGNILQAKLYNQGYVVPAGQTYSEALYTNITVVNPTDKLVGKTLNFNATSGCIPGVKFVWDFGDGTGTVQSYNVNVSHVYDTAGTFTVTLSIQHPQLTTYTTTQSITIVPPSLTSSLCASGIIRMNTCNNTKFYNNCPGKPLGNVDSPNGTKFYTTVSGCSGTYTYNWELSFDGINFFDYSTTSLNYEVIPQNDFGMDFYMRCRVTSSCNMEGTTNSIKVQYNCSVF